MLPGVLDIGSDSAQLQVFEARPGAPRLQTHAVKEPTLLGESFGPDGTIDPAGVDRVVEAVNHAMSAARRLGVQQLYVFTTSAVRDAANRDLILDRVEAEAGVRPQYLSGEDEARLIYLAVHQWFGWSAGRLLILDIGGGSMEIVLGRDAEPELAVSLPLGAGRLTRQFLPDDPPQAAGAKLTMPAQDMFWGDRYGQIVDPFGYRWAVATRKENLSRDEVNRRAAAMFAA